MAALADLGREIGEIAEKVGPSVVGIGNRWRGGSGVVIATMNKAYQQSLRNSLPALSHRTIYKC